MYVGWKKTKRLGAYPPQGLMRFIIFSLICPVSLNISLTSHHFGILPLKNCELGEKPSCAFCFFSKEVSDY